MKNYLIIGAIVAISIIGIWILAERSDEQRDSTSTETSVPNEPEAYDPSLEPGETADYTSQYNTDLSLSYPVSWNVTEGADNSAEQQLVTFESPMDSNEYYFCLDLTEVSAASDIDSSTSDANIFLVDSLEAGGTGGSLSSVIFNVEENGNLLWSLTNREVSAEQTAFDNRIANPNGRSLQTLGRFNCRETDSYVTDLQQFENSRWFNAAQTILRTLTY